MVDTLTVVLLRIIIMCTYLDGWRCYWKRIQFTLKWIGMECGFQSSCTVLYTAVERVLFGEIIWLEDIAIWKVNK